MHPIGIYLRDHPEASLELGDRRRGDPDAGPHGKHGHYGEEAFYDIRVEFRAAHGNYFIERFHGAELWREMLPAAYEHVVRIGNRNNFREPVDQSYLRKTLPCWPVLTFHPAGITRAVLTLMVGIRRQANLSGE